MKIHKPRLSAYHAAIGVFVPVARRPLEYRRLRPQE